MPRARNIKPGFFTNEVLAALPALTRLLFVGLWTLADREGRLEDRPGKIKLQVLPLDDTDVDAALGELADAGFIERYVVAGQHYIQIATFVQHQHPHPREIASVIPAPLAVAQTVGTDTTLAGAQPEARQTVQAVPTTDQPEACLGNGEVVAEHNLGTTEAPPRSCPAGLVASPSIPSDSLDAAEPQSDSLVTTPSGSVPGREKANARAHVREGSVVGRRRPTKAAIRNALCAACYDGRAPPVLTPPERDELDKASVALATQPDATPAEIARRVAYYEARYPHMPPPKPRAIAGNWTNLGLALAQDGTHETPGRTADDDAFLAAFDAALAEQPAALPPGAGGPRRPAP